MVDLIKKEHMKYDNILVEQESPLATITINRPSKLNALNKDTIKELHDAFKALDKDKNIKAIYSTNYKRTKQTAQPLADELGLKVQIYDPNQLKALKEMLLEKHKKGSILIVGHSNTTPTLVNTFMETDKYAPLNDANEFDKIFKIEVRNNGFKTSEKMTGLTNPK